MSSFCGASMSRNPFNTPVQAKNNNPFSGSISQQHSSQALTKFESPIQFGGAVIGSLKSSQPKAWITEIWHLHSSDLEPVVQEPASLWENARVEFLAKVRPQQKADRAIAIGLNQSLKKFSEAGQKSPTQKPFLNALAMNDTHFLTPSGGLGPHFLA